MRILITSGPTREYIDDVRFISNPSSGRMGHALAQAAIARGHSVRFLSGPTCLSAPEGVEVERFESVEELYSLVAGSLEGADCLIMAAAVGDWRPRERLAGKRKKTSEMTLELVATRDVLKSVACLKGSRVFVGFAVEAADAVDNAQRKVRDKSLDLLVLNSPESFGAETADFTLVFAGGRTLPLGRVAKSAVAAAVLDEVEGFFHGGRDA